MAELPSVAVFIIAVIVLYVVLKILSVPLKLLKSLVVNAIAGGIILFLVNYVGAALGLSSLHIDINIVTALVTGIFGIPGVILLLILKFLL